MIKKSGAVLFKDQRSSHPHRATQLAAIKIPSDERHRSIADTVTSPPPSLVLLRRRSKFHTHGHNSGHPSEWHTSSCRLLPLWLLLLCKRRRGSLFRDQCETGWSGHCQEKSGRVYQVSVCKETACGSGDKWREHRPVGSKKLRLRGGV